MHTKFPHIQVRKNCLIYYELSEFRPPAANRKIGMPSYSGKVTDGARKRLLKAIDILLQVTPIRTIFNPVTQKFQPFQLNFVTLTISSSEIIDAKTAYRQLMKPYLRKLRKNHDFSYIWKAELQKRGQLHYHLATNTYLPWSDIRNNWNNLQRSAGLLQEYGMKHGHYDANSTDVHAISHINDVGAYLSKYLSKGQKASINGKTWDCSTDLKRNRFSFELTNYTQSSLEKAIKDKHCKVVELEHCTIFKVKNPIQYLDSSTLKNYLTWKY